MTTMQELYSWLTPPSVELSSPPEIGKPAPEKAPVKIPQPGNKPVVIAFLRHCGCPFAEKTFLQLQDTATKNTSIHFVAVSHSNQAHTTKWLQDIGGTKPSNLEIVVDDKREFYGAWGLGVASVWHVLNPRGLFELYKMAREEGIVNRPTESGFRWQTSGAWAVDGDGKIVWGGVAGVANAIPDFSEAVEAVRRDTVGRASL